MNEIFNYNDGPKVLVIGGAGYCLSPLVDMLSRQRYRVTVYDSLMYEKRYLKEVDLVRADIRDTNKLVGLASGYDYVVFGGALVGDSACEVSQDITREVNYLAVKRFCERLPKDIPISFLSTCSVFGKNDSLLDETSPTNPLSCYAKYKLEAEKPILERGGTVLRLGTLYGLGDTYSRCRFDLVVNVITAKAWKYKELNVCGQDQMRPILAVRDVAAYLDEWCFRIDVCPAMKGQVYILAKENVNIKELGERVAACIPGTKVNYTEISFEDARNYHVNTAKADKTFVHTPKITVEDEVKKLVKVLEDGRIDDFEDPIYHNGSYLKFKKGRNEFN